MKAIKFCPQCCHNVTAEKGMRLKHMNGRVTEFHKSCAKKLLKESPIIWKVYEKTQINKGS